MTLLVPHTITLDIVHPITAAPIGLKLTLTGQDHDEYQDFLTVFGQEIQTNGTKVEDTQTVEFQKNFILRSIASYINGWEITSDDVKAMFATLGIDEAYSVAGAEKLVLAKGVKYIRDQITDAVKNRQSFF